MRLMNTASRTFRLFISSTFSDLVAERNALQAHVFPRLRELAAAHGCRFQAIDLRWGVSEEAGLDQQTMRVCLTEIERSQRLSPRPNFLVLLGDRYGWRPLPYAIPAGEMERLLPFVPAAVRAHLLWREGQPAGDEGWYRLDANAVPPEYLLLPRTKGTRYEEYSTWEGEVERPLLAALEGAARQAGLEGDALVKYTHSATAQEVERGVMQVADAGAHVFAFFREVENPDQVPSAMCQAYLESDSLLRQRQQALKAALRERLPGNVHEYSARWLEGGLSTAHIGSLPESLEECLALCEAGDGGRTLCEATWLRLSRVILAETGKLQAVDPLQREKEAHEEFAAERARHFVGREQSQVRIAEYLLGADRRPLVVWGESGSGKSALMARALHRAKATYPPDGVIGRFVGATPDSSNRRAMLESLCREAARASHGNESSVPLEYEKLVDELPVRLAAAAAEKPLVLFLDALDQLSGAEADPGLAWLPAELPPNVKVVVSTTPGAVLQALEGRLPPQNRLRVEAVPPREGETILDAWLAAVGRTLEPRQREHVLAHFQACGLPLYLRLVFEEARRWHSYDALPKLAPDIPGMIRQLFGRLSQEANHGALLVERSLGYLAAAKDGLSEDEMLDVLSRDQHVLADMLRRSPKSPTTGRLPAVLWSRLYLDLEAYLSEHEADGSIVLGFYHRQLAEAAAEDLLAGDRKRERHAGLARYFEGQPLAAREGRETAHNLRKLSELPFQQAWSGDAAGLAASLADWRFVEAKAGALGIQPLIEDYALTGVPVSWRPAGLLQERVAGLAAIQSALRLSASSAAQDPGCLWGQLYGRLVGREEVAVRTLLATPPARPWLRPLGASLAAPGGTLERTVALHDWARRVALTPDGTRVVCADPVQVVDLASGRVLFTLGKDSGTMWHLLVLPGGERAVTGSEAGNIELWDIRHGAALGAIAAHKGGVTALAAVAGGSALLSGGADGLVKEWDLSGKLLRSLSGHSARVNAVAVSLDGRIVLSGSVDKSARLWDLTTGRTLRQLEHTAPVFSVAFSGDGQLALTMERLRARVWDVSSGKQVVSVGGRERAHEAALSPDASRLLVAVASGEDGLEEDFRILVLGLKGGSKQLVLRGHTRRIEGIVMLPDGKRAVSYSGDGSIRVWDLASGQERVLRHSNPALGVKDLALSADGRRAVSTSGGELKLWDLQTLGADQDAGAHRDQVNGVRVTHDGARAITSSRDHNLIVWDVAGGGRLATLQGHAGEVVALALTRDGRIAISAAEDGTVRVWDVVAGRERHVLKVPDASALALTPDERFVITGGTDDVIRAWRLADGQAVCTFAPGERWYGTPGRVTQLLVLPGGGELVVTNNNREEPELIDLRVLDEKRRPFSLGPRVYRRSGRFLRKHERQVSTAALSPSGLLVSGSLDGTLVAWDIAAEKPARVWTPGKAVYAAAFLDERRLLTLFEKSQMRMWDTRTGRELPCPDLDVLPPFSLGEGGRWLAAVSRQHRQKVTLWDLPAGREVASFTGDSSIRCCALAPGGRTLLVGEAGGAVHILRREDPEAPVPSDVPAPERKPAVPVPQAAAPQGRAPFTSDLERLREQVGKAPDYRDAAGRLVASERPQQARVLAGHTGSVKVVALTPDGQQGISGSIDRTVNIWHLESGEVVRTLRGHEAPVLSLAVTPDGARVAAGSADPAVRVWDLQSGRMLHTLSGHVKPVYALAVTPDGRLLVSGSWDRTVRIWDLAEGRLLRTLPRYTSEIKCLVLAAGGQQAVCGAYDNTIQVWDVESGAILRTLEGHRDKVMCVALAPGGARLASGSWDRSVRVWDLASGRALRTLEGHTNTVTAVAFAADGERVVSVSEDWTLKVWEPGSGRLVRSIKHTHPLTSVVVTPDGTQAVCGSLDGTVQVWGLT